MITNVKTEYEVTLDTPVILTDEHHYKDRENRNLTRATYEVTGARVTTAPGMKPYVELLGFALLPSGDRSKKQKGVAKWVPHVGILTRHADGSATSDTSAYDGIVATVLAEVTAAEADPEDEPNIAGGYYPAGPLRSSPSRPTMKIGF